MSDGRGLLEELRRRHVWRVAVAYAIAAWLLVQIARQTAAASAPASSATK